MDKKALAILLVASSFASSSFATSIINKLIPKHSSVTSIAAHKTTKQTNRPYTDFSGTWIFDCGDGSTSISTVIENDANYITLDGDESRIGPGLKGVSESNEAYTSSVHTSFEWNTDGSALTMKSVDFSKSNIDNSAIETGMATFTLTMKNDQINLDGKFTMFEDVTQIEQPVNIHCVLSKKQNNNS